MTSPAPDATPVVDGRHARRARTRQVVVEAVLDLLAEGQARPTAIQVAERSGVSLRSIFRIFDDVESLHAAAARGQMARTFHLYVDLPSTGPLDQRVAAIVAAHETVYAGIAPVRRFGLRKAAEGPSPVANQLQMARAWLRMEFLRVFEPELGAPGSRPQDDPTVVALELALSFEAWDQLAGQQGLDVPDRCAVLERTVRVLLAADGRP